MLKLDNRKKNVIVQTYNRLPLWGKVAAPALAIVLVLVFFKLIKSIIIIGLIAAAVYLVLKFMADKDK